MQNHKSVNPDARIITAPYLAGFIDAEGTIQKRVYTLKSGYGPYITKSIRAVNTNEEVIRAIQKDWGGYVSVHSPKIKNWKTVFAWCVSSRPNVQRVGIEILPHLIIKKQRLAEVLNLPAPPQSRTSWGYIAGFLDGDGWIVHDCHSITIGFGNRNAEAITTIASFLHIPVNVAHPYGVPYFVARVQDHQKVLETLTNLHPLVVRRSSAEEAIYANKEKKWRETRSHTAQWPDIKRDYECGLPSQQILKKYDITLSTLNHLRFQNRVPSRNTRFHNPATGRIGWRPMTNMVPPHVDQQPVLSQRAPIRRQIKQRVHPADMSFGGLMRRWYGHGDPSALEWTFPISTRRYTTATLPPLGWTGGPNRDDSRIPKENLE